MSENKSSGLLFLVQFSFYGTNSSAKVNRHLLVTPLCFVLRMIEVCSVEGWMKIHKQMNI